MYTVSNLKTDLERKVSNLNKVKSVDSLIEEAARNVISQIDSKGTKRVSDINNIFYDDVYTYALPEDVNALTDIRPTDNQQVNFRRRSTRGFYRELLDESFAVSNDAGIKTLKLRKKFDGAQTIDDMNSLDNFSAARNGRELYDSRDQYVTGQSAVGFEVTSGGRGGITLNKSYTLHNKTAIFVLFFLPTREDADNIDRLYIKFNDTDELFTDTPHDKSDWKHGWNVVRFDLTNDMQREEYSVDSTELGIVNAEANTFSNVLFDSLTAQAGVPYKIEYYSEWLFSDDNGFRPDISADSNEINLDKESYNCLLYEAAQIAAEELEERNNQQKYWSKLWGSSRSEGLYDQYKDKYRSERIHIGRQYYDVNLFNK